MPLHWEVRADPATATPYFVNHAAQTTSPHPPAGPGAKAAHKPKRQAVAGVEALARVGTPAEAAAAAKAEVTKAAAAQAVARPPKDYAALQRCAPSLQPEYGAALTALVQHRETLEKLRLEVDG